MTTPMLPFAPVICIDSPSAAGGTSTAEAVALKLGFNLLQSGALYRAVAYSALLRGCQSNEEDCAWIASELKIQYRGKDIYLSKVLVTEKLRTDVVSKATSSIAKMPKVRAALMAYQLNCRQLPGLVADGRDMAYIFDGGKILRVFLTAPAEVRAQRRLQQMPNGSVYQDVLDGIIARDKDDMEREHSPLQQHPEAILIDNSNLSLIAVRDRIISVALERGVLIAA